MEVGGCNPYSPASGRGAILLVRNVVLIFIKYIGRWTKSEMSMITKAVITIYPYVSYRIKSTTL